MSQSSTSSGWYLWAMLPVLGLASTGWAHTHPSPDMEKEAIKAVQAPARSERNKTNWSKQPLLLIAGRPEAGISPFAANGLESSQLTVFSPDRNQPPQTLDKEQGRWLAKPLEMGVGGFHWLTSRSASVTEIRSAASVVMFPGKGPSPAQLLSDYPMGLDIRPVRLPERGSFREGSEWSFLVRFDGLPVANKTLLLETENGTQAKFPTSTDGIATVIFPRDFDPASIDQEAGMTRTRKGYVVSAELEREGVKHVSAFNYFYSPDVMRERSLLWGAGFTLLGMGLALPLLRRKEAGHA